jgi:hypothetical protein
MEIGGGYLFVKFIPKIIIMPAMDGGLRAACNEDVDLSMFTKVIA